MSQENVTGSKQSRRRESILKTQLFEAEEFKDKQKRRVSFRNVKEVQIYNTDKNCPDLLHSSPPKKEKINETLGSDGVFTPGRTTLSEISNHSPKNNTVAMFNVTGQQQPESSAPKEPSPRFMIEDDITPPTGLGMDKTSHTALDMSIASDTSKMDDTLQMFSKSFVQAPADGSTLNSTMEMFGNTLRQADTTPIRHDNTLTMFKSPSAASRKRISMSSTMVIFQEEVCTNNTLKMFGDATDAERQNSTLQMFGDTSLPPVPEEDSKPTLKHEVTVNKTFAMDVSMEGADETIEVTKQMESSNLGSPSINIENNTLDMFGEAMEVDDKDKTIVDKAQVSCTEKEQENCRVGTSMHMSILQNNTTMHLTNDVEDAVIARQDISSKSLNASAIKSPAPVRKPNMSVLGRTMDIFASSQEYQNVTVGGRNSEHELPRRINVAELLNFSEVSIQLEKTVLNDKTVQEQTHLIDMSEEKTLLFDKTDTVSETTHLFEKTMEVTINKTANMTATALSQSLKGRRRSLNTSLQNVIDSPILSPNPDLTLEEQLSFTMRNSLFDDHCAQMGYLLREEGGPMAHALRQKAIAELEASVELSTAQNKTLLSNVFVELRNKDSKKAAAVEAVNGRNLGPLDRDIILAARYEAEFEWYKTRTSVAENLKKELESLTTKLADKLKDVEQKALLCENGPAIEAEVAQLENELLMLSSHNAITAVAAEERHNQLLLQLEQAEHMERQAKLKTLQTELEFSKRKVEEQRKLAVLLNAAKQEKEENQKLILQMIRNASRQETMDPASTLNCAQPLNY